MKMMALTVSLIACVYTVFQSQTAVADDGPSYKIGLIAKSESNPVFLAARVGGGGSRGGVKKKINNQGGDPRAAPGLGGPQKQAGFIEQLTVVGVDGIAL